MLCLSRKKNDKITITTDFGEKIVIMVTDIEGGQVKLGIEAPTHFAIERDNMKKGAEDEQD
jgi:carbon storage regulator CsrA